MFFDRSKIDRFALHLRQKGTLSHIEDFLICESVCFSNKKSSVLVALLLKVYFTVTVLHSILNIFFCFGLLLHPRHCTWNPLDQLCKRWATLISPFLFGRYERCQSEDIRPSVWRKFRSYDDTEVVRRVTVERSTFGNQPDRSAVHYFKHQINWAKYIYI
jgi:hypothetical protein